MRREQKHPAGVRPGSKPAHTSALIGYTTQRDAIPAIATALTALTDPSTLTWLLSLLEQADGDAAPAVTRSREALVRHAVGPHLTVRALARRLLRQHLPGAEPPPASSPSPDTALINPLAAGLWTPDHDGIRVGDRDEVAEATQQLIDDVVGARLTRSERLLPQLGAAVRARVTPVLADDQRRSRWRERSRNLNDQTYHHIADAYLAMQAAVEDALQRAAAGGRAVRLATGNPVPDPLSWEDTLASALLDDPTPPLALESLRRPRPDLPPPSPQDLQGQPLPPNTSTEGTTPITGTVAITPATAVATIRTGPHRGWRILATAENRTIPNAQRYGPGRHLRRYRAVEIRQTDDSTALTAPPLAPGNIRTWWEPIHTAPWPPDLHHTQPLVGLDQDLAALADAPTGLGVPAPLLTPTSTLLYTLDLQPEAPFTLHDPDGPALTLVTWRTEYESGGYRLPWPRLRGCALLIRPDVLDRLREQIGNRLVLRDVATVPPLCG